MPKRKIAIVGCASPIADMESLIEMQIQGYEIWSLNNLYISFSEIAFTRWFELHHFTRRGSCYIRRGQTEYGGYSTIKEYLDAINELDIPVYIQRLLAPIKKGLRFPFRDIMRAFGTQYFGCSFAWMIALALYEHLHGKKIDAIAMVGASLSAWEYYFQRPSTEHWLGVAKGMGIKVEISNTSNLLKAPWIYAYKEDFDCVDTLYVSVVKEMMTMASIPMQEFFQNAYYRGEVID